MPQPPVSPNAVFLNIPYDDGFQKLYLAYIVGIYELGLSITWAKLNPKRHSWFLWESEPRRIQKSMSDLDGTDPYIHSGTVEGVLSELRNAFVSSDAPPLARMMEAYRVVEGGIGRILVDAGTQNVYAASVFKEICLLALDAASGPSVTGK